METAVEISSLKQDIQELNPALIERINVLEANVVQLCHIADSEHPDFKMDDVGALQRDFEANYELAKSSLLYSGSRGKLPIERHAALARLYPGTATYHRSAVQGLAVYA